MASRSQRVIAVALLALIAVGDWFGSARRRAPRASRASGLAAAPGPRRCFAGSPSMAPSSGTPAPLTLTEFADLQCPFCARYAREVLPSLVRRYVRAGKVRLVFRNLAFIGPDSVRTARIAAAAGLQGRLWQFTDLVFYNQGQENSGYATVESSAFAEVAGIPVAVLGVVGYAPILASAWIPGEQGRTLSALLALIGFGYSACLTYREVFTLDAVCLWCLASAVLMTILAGLATCGWSRTHRRLIPWREADAMYSLVPLYLSIAVGIPAVVAVVAVQTAAADVVGGVVVLAALAVGTRAVLQLLAGERQTAGGTRS